MLRRSIPAGVAFAAVLAMLAGCVGIPTSGGVQTGNVIDSQLAPGFVVVPESPQPGATPEQILEGFMQAMRGPQNNYFIARQYLTTDFSTQWRPETNVLIRTGAVSVSQVDESTLSYTVTSRASVDENGHYTQTRDSAGQILKYSIAKENGEWRISRAPDGIVLAQSSFDGVFQQRSLYFFDPSFTFLVPDVRWFPALQAASKQAVTELLAGPTSWLGQGVVVSAFPPATKVESVTLDSGVVVVDLSTEALAANPVDRDRMRQQLSATLGSQSIRLTVRGLPLAVPEPSGDRASVNPDVDSAVLIGAGTAFGFDGGAGIVTIPGLSDQLVAGGAVAASVSRDKLAAAFLAADGSVSLALVGTDIPLQLDERPGLTAPSIDPLRFVWSAQKASAASLVTFDSGGGRHELQPGLPVESSIVSMDVSRDGTRLLLYLVTPIGPQLLVYGIIRQDDVPIALGSPESLPVGSEAPIDATWVDERTVASVGTSDAGAIVTSFEIGGPSTPLGTLDDAREIVGGNGRDGLRLLRADGEVWRPRGSGGWVSTGISAGFLATQQ